MYGLILVEPKEGLPAVDNEFYVMQGDFYTKGGAGATGLQEFDVDKALDAVTCVFWRKGYESATLPELLKEAKAFPSSPIA